MKTFIGDIETDGLQPTRIHCLVILDTESGGFSTYTDSAMVMDDMDSYRGQRLVFHNGLGFDIPVLSKLWGIDLHSECEIVDTYVVSKLVRYPKFSTHSLEELGRSNGEKKSLFTDWNTYTPEMLEYCKQDVRVTYKVYKELERFVIDPVWKKAIDIEHKAARICYDMQHNGFKFEREKAVELLTEVEEEMARLEAEFQVCWPPKLVEVNRLKYRVRADGQPFASVAKAASRYARVEVEGDELVCYDYDAFDPASPKKRIDKLWEAGWKPTEKTKGHYQFTKARLKDEERAANFKRYGWTCSEENLDTLPPDAPAEGKKLAEWLTLEGRRSSLEEWIGKCKPDGRLHGKFWSIGAWTHRMSHSEPNSANIFSVFSGTPRTPAEEIKARYDGRARALWSTDHWLVGTDADGIQLRILAHLLRSPEYVESIVSGKKEDGTDIHSLNKGALGGICRSRDDAKTFIYAWLLGAGIPKVSRILQCSVKDASDAVQRFVSSVSGLSTLKGVRIPSEARRGYFTGLDGRKVLCDSEHLMLAGHLQNGEAVVMKAANWLWREWAEEKKINYRQVNFVHDEWQTECLDGEDAAHELGKLQAESIRVVGEQLGLYCPLAGSYSVGRNWMETH